MVNNLSFFHIYLIGSCVREKISPPSRGERERFGNGGLMTTGFRFSCVRPFSCEEEDGTHLSGVDLLTAERIVVGTHLERRRCATGRDEMLSVGVGWLSRFGLCGVADREVWHNCGAGALAKVRHVTSAALGRPRCFLPPTYIFRCMRWGE